MVAEMSEEYQKITKHIDGVELVDILVNDYDDGLPILISYRQQNPYMNLETSKYVVENTPFYFASDLIRQEADELVTKLIQLGAEVEIV